MSDSVWGLFYIVIFSFAGGALFSEVAWSPAMAPTLSTMMALAVSPPSFWPSLPWCSGGGDNIILFIPNQPLTLKIVQLWRTLKGGLDGPQSGEQRLWENVDHTRADSFCSHWLWSSGDSKAVWIRPISVSCLIRTSGKDIHSQPDSTSLEKKRNNEIFQGGQDWPTVSREGSGRPRHRLDLQDARRRLRRVRGQPQQEGEDLHGLRLASQGGCSGMSYKKWSGLWGSVWCTLQSPSPSLSCCTPGRHRPCLPRQREEVQQTRVGTHGTRNSHLGGV